MVHSLMAVTDSVYLYKAGANLYDDNRFAPVLLNFTFTGLSAVHKEVRSHVIQKGKVCVIQMFLYLSE